MLKTTTKEKLTASLRGINGKLIFQHPRLNIRSSTYTSRMIACVALCVEQMFKDEVVIFCVCVCDIPVKMLQGEQEHMAKCFPSRLR